MIHMAVGNPNYKRLMLDVKSNGCMESKTRLVCLCNGAFLLRMGMMETEPIQF
ncbi:hypothetical protein Lalb_Chr05g0215851 [Lupinus albus]|uniref:Uncharacterized protein n=1 Tax=Lupinus albus TaxID=3870 RepID=A0A6A4QHT9_LUPAL|nr:hypothetical protein Lalb_Chr05g0215851 [Lupinus albus]